MQTIQQKYDETSFTVLIKKSKKLTQNNTSEQKK